MPAPFTRSPNGLSLLRSVLVAIVLLLGVWGAVAAGAPDGDITPPVLVGASADRLSIDTSETAQTITYSLHITDDLSGVVRVQVDLRHEQGYNDVRMCFMSVDVSTDVFVAYPVVFPQYSAEGRWLVSAYYLTDGVGNVRGQQVVDCVGGWVDNRCVQYEYNELATPAIRSMEVWIGAANPDADPPLWLPLIMAP